jgi:regulator of protease activity HflC (stomatin/prohibitin superfamily)
MNSLPFALYILAVMSIGLAFAAGRAFGHNAGTGAAAIATMAAVACLAGAALRGWTGLAAAVLVVGLLIWLLARSTVQEQGAGVLALLWLLYAGLCAAGYGLGGEWGLLFISLPNLTLLWAGLYVLANQILPVGTPEERLQALRSLVTFTLGTNYPLHLIRDDSAKPRVDGNPDGELFAGPGVVLVDPAHVAVLVTRGTAFSRLCPPGLTFTDRYERVHQVIDLRPQLRSFNVEALTRDGVPLQVLAFVVFKIQSGQARPRLGTAFPFRPGAVYRAVFEQPVSNQGQTASRWDALVPVTADRLLCEILRDYTCDQLSEPFNPTADPRSEIQQKLVAALAREVSPWGIDVLDGGIGDLKPDEEVIDGRIESWKATWKRRRQEWKTEADEDARRAIQDAHAQVEAEFVEEVVALSGISSFAGVRDPDALEACRDQIVEALQQKRQSLPAATTLPPEMVKILERL